MSLDPCQERKTSPKKIIININGPCSEPPKLGTAFGKHFSQVSSNENYDPEFLTYKLRKKQRIIEFPTDSNEFYNQPFTFKELEFATKKVGTSPGSDDILYDFLSNLPNEQKQNLLGYFNFVWENNLFPSQWGEAIVLPFLKPNKPPQCTSSYRPISLTSCICKTLERMVLPRLTIYLGSQNYLRNYQSGFRRLHSTIDSLVRLESAIMETFLKNEYLIAVFLDIEKAYDMLWRYSIAQAMEKMGLKGHLPKFIMNFLPNRSMRIKIGAYISESFIIENGIP